MTSIVFLLIWCMTWCSLAAVSPDMLNGFRVRSLSRFPYFCKLIFVCSCIVPKNSRSCENCICLPKLLEFFVFVVLLVCACFGWRMLRRIWDLWCCCFGLSVMATPRGVLYVCPFLSKPCLLFWLFWCVCVLYVGCGSSRNKDRAGLTFIPLHSVLHGFSSLIQGAPVYHLHGSLGRDI